MNRISNDFGLVLFSVITWFATMLGLPPEPRDPALLRCAPKDSAVYLEWAGRGTGKSGGTEFEGLMADQEIRAFFGEADAAIRRLLTEALEGSEGANDLAKSIPEIQRMLIMNPGSISVKFGPALVGPAVKKAQESGVEIPVEMQGFTGIEGTLIFQMGENPEEMEQHFLRTIRTATEGDVDSAKLDRTEIPLKIPGLRVIFHRHQGYLIVSTQQTGIDSAIAGIDGKDQGLGEQARFQKSTGKVVFPRTGSLLWIDTKGIYGAMSTGFGLPGMMANGVVTMLGLEKIDSIACASGIEEGKVAVRNWTETRGATGKSLAFSSGKGIDKSRFDLVPRDADLVVAGSLDLPKAISEYEKLAVALSKGEMFEPWKEFQSHLKEMELGISELLKPFADNAIVYDAPGSGGLIFSGPVLLLEVRDRELAKVLVDKLVRLIREKLPPFDERSRGVLLSEGEFLGEKIYFTDQVVQGPKMINPAFCLTKDSLVIGLHPQSIKGHLRMVSESSTPRFSSRLSDGKEGFAVPEGRLLLVRYLNLQSAGRLFLPLLPYGEIQASSQLHMTRIGMPVLYFPSSAAILPYLKDHLSAVVRNEEGIEYYGAGSLPPQIIDTLLWLLPAAGMGVYDAMVFDSGPGLKFDEISKTSLVETEMRLDSDVRQGIEKR